MICRTWCPTVPHLDPAAALHRTHQRPEATDDWPKVGRRLGVDLRIGASGRCGMAGLYGHERANRSTSEAIYALGWAAILADARHTGRTLATGIRAGARRN